MIILLLSALLTVAKSETYIVDYFFIQLLL